MFDIGGWEFMLIVILGIVIIGPKELPGALRNITLWIRKARGLAREFQSGIDDIVQEAEFEKIREEVMEGSDPTGSISGIKDEISQAIDPDGDLEKSISGDDAEDWFSDHGDLEDDPGEEDHAMELPNQSETDASIDAQSNDDKSNV